MPSTSALISALAQYEQLGFNIDSLLENFDARGQGVACGNSWIPKGKKCSKEKAATTSKEAKQRTVEKQKARQKLRAEVEARPVTQSTAKPVESQKETAMRAASGLFAGKYGKQTQKQFVRDYDPRDDRYGGKQATDHYLMANPNSEEWQKYQKAEKAYNAPGTGAYKFNQYSEAKQELGKAVHKFFVESNLANDKPVGSSVLKEYPDLVDKYAKPARRERPTRATAGKYSASIDSLEVAR